MRIFTAYWKQIVCSPMTYFSVLCISAVCFFGMSSQTPSFGVIYAFDVMLDLSSYRKLMMLFAALPFVSRFAQEWNANASNQIIARTSPRKYIFAHISVSFLTAFLTVFLGILLCVGFLCIKYPLYLDHGNSYDGAFMQLLTEKGAALYLLFRTLHYSFSIAIWGLSGLAISSVFLNSFIAICTPLVFSYTLELLTIESVFLPDLWRLSLSYTGVSSNPWIASLYIVLVFSVLGALFSTVFANFSRRRIENEIH